MPLLYPVGMFCSMSSYWIDKYLFLRLFRRPPLFDEAMASRGVTLIKIGLCIHCIMSIYIYSNDEIFSYEEKSASINALKGKVDGYMGKWFGYNSEDLEA